MLQFKDNKGRETQSGPSGQKHKGSQEEAGGRGAVGDHRISNVGGCLGQGLSQTAAGGVGVGGGCFRRQEMFSPGEDRNHSCR